MFDVKDVVLLVVGGFAGVFAERAWTFTIGLIQRLKIRQKLKDVSTSEKDAIFTIQSALPSFAEERIVVRLGSEKFFLPFPEDICVDGLAMHPSSDFEGNSKPKSIYDAIEQETRIEGLAEKLVVHSRKVAEQFKKKEAGCNFNNVKYGVFNINSFNRVDEIELPEIRLELYETDYFTHRVMRSVYQELRREKHGISSGDGVRDYNFAKYRYFTTSLGVNGVLILRASNEILLAERSGVVINAEGAASGRKYISFSEGVSVVDLDRQFRSILLTRCIYRALEEEVGLKDEMIKKDSLKICDCYLDFEKYEIGFTSSIETKDSYNEKPVILDFIRGLPRSDSHESRLIAIAFKQPDLRQFVTKNEFIPQGLYGLRMICARNGIYI